MKIDIQKLTAHSLPLLSSVLCKVASVSAVGVNSSVLFTLNLRITHDIVSNNVLSLQYYTEE